LHKKSPTINDLSDPPSTKWGYHPAFQGVNIAPMLRLSNTGLVTKFTVGQLTIAVSGAMLER
jgi:hypothetical protein